MSKYNYKYRKYNDYSDKFKVGDIVQSNNPKYVFPLHTRFKVTGISNGMNGQLMNLKCLDPKYSVHPWTGYKSMHFKLSMDVPIPETNKIPQKELYLIVDHMNEVLDMANSLDFAELLLKDLLDEGDQEDKLSIFKLVKTGKLAKNPIIWE